MTSRDGSIGLDRLRRLSDAPAERTRLAAQLLERERNPEVVLAALAVLAERPDPAHRPLLLRLYDHYQANPARRDQGGALRVGILKALGPVALAEDVPLLERAAVTYEFLFGEVAGGLRAAALLALDRLDPPLAGFHAVRLLTDRHTSIMSGEPAVTAARLLGARGDLLPLYGYVCREDDGQGEVVAECLRGLTTLPASLLPSLIARYRATTDEIILLGLFDLLLAHERGADHLPFIFDFLQTTRLLTIHRYLVTELVARRDETAIAALQTMATSETDRVKLEALRAALALHRPAESPPRRRRGG